MVKIKPFKGVRPPKDIVAEVASRPYDVLNSAEAKAEAGEKSLLHIIKPEIDFDPIADEHSQEVYDKAVENFKKWQANGWLKQDPTEKYYVYAQTMDGRTQYGLVAACHCEDYMTGKIKKHELTRKDKEEDRMIHVRIQNANVEPVFFAYPAVAEMDSIISKVVAASAPEQYIGKVIEVLATEVSKNKDGGFSLSYPRFIEFRDKSVDDVDRIVSKGKGFEIVGRD